MTYCAGAGSTAASAAAASASASTAAASASAAAASVASAAAASIAAVSSAIGSTGAISSTAISSTGASSAASPQAERASRAVAEKAARAIFFISVLQERERIPQDSHRASGPQIVAKIRQRKRRSHHSSVRISTVSPSRKNNTKGAQAASNGGYPPKLPIASAALSTTK